MKTLRICLAQELPSESERDKDYYYLLYDKLILYRGLGPYYDPFVITDEIPDDPIAGCLYITFEGSIKAFIGDDIVTLAEIEDPAQAAHLPDLGTTYFIHADKRYFDLRHRTLQLPYYNGTYSLNVSMAKDIKIDEKSAILYDGRAQRFYMVGEYDGPPRFRGYRGLDTDSVETVVYDHCIHSHVKVSPARDNLLQLTNSGLYVSVEDKASAEEYAALVAEYEEFRKNADAILEELEKDLEDVEATASEESLYNLMIKALENYYGDISQMIEFYTQAGKQLESIEKDSMAYTDDVFDKVQQEISVEIESVLPEEWGTF